MNDDSPSDAPATSSKRRIDKDATEWTVEDFRRAKPASALASEILAAFSRTREKEV
jgi:hypothetical protein